MSSLPAVPRPAGLEVLANLMLGDDSCARALPARAGDVHGALERVLVDALARPPCLVSFSGGRDSSAVLALATAVARRHGLHRPVPATLRFRRAPASRESEWQRAVLEHLGITAHEVLELDDELDALGAVATGVLARHGLLWPGNAYMHVPLLALAAGGTLLTGIGGDELFTTSAPPRGVRGHAAAMLPAAVRETRWRRRHAPPGYGWLTAAGRREVLRALAREEVRCPYPWDAALRHWQRTRAFGALDGTLRVLGGDHDVRVANPLLEPSVLAAFAARGGRRGFATRTAAMEWLCGDLLPAAVLRRPTKAGFGEAVWGPAMRAWLAGWDGRGIDPRRVDPERLREELSRPEPDVRVLLLLQQAWLAAQPASAPSS